MAEKNATILEQIWLAGTNDFQQRVPKPTQGNIAQVQKAIFSYRPTYNQFVDILINRIGLTYVLSKKWENPLALVKRDSIQFGDTIQEIAVQLLKAKGYELDAQTLLEVNRPESKCAYHQVDRQDKYPVTINEVELRKAFINDYGLNDYVAAVMAAQINSDNYDEYQIMKQLIAEYENSNGGFFKVKVDDVLADSTGAAAKGLLKQIRAYLGKMKFLSALYNKAGYNGAFCRPEDTILMITPDVKAAIDVDALATLFHIEKAEVDTRIIEVDEFPVVGCQAILVDKDWFVCGDYVYTNESFYNGEQMATNYWLHHWGIYSTSPFCNAIMFTTGEATTPSTTTVSITGMNHANVTTIKNKSSVDLGIVYTGTVTGSDVVKLPAAGINVTGINVYRQNTGGTKDYISEASSDVNVSTAGILKIKDMSKYLTEEFTKLFITVDYEGTYINPSNTTPSLSGTITVEVKF